MKWKLAIPALILGTVTAFGGFGSGMGDAGMGMGAAPLCSTFLAVLFSFFDISYSIALYLLPHQYIAFTA